MNSPFTKVQPQRKAPLREWLSAWRAPLVFGVCLLVGAGLVWWRAQQRVNAAYEAAFAQARACAAALELELNQPCAAAETLGTIARHGRLGLTNSFQAIAREVFAAHAGLAALELQPGGVVSDIVPRPGNERAVGFNVLKDPAQHAGAAEAIGRRGLTITIPVTLYHGEQGMVARVPIFQRAANGREFFWGFVAASMRLQDALARAQVQELPRQGYDFALSVKALPKPRVIAAQGLGSAQEGVQLRAQNLEFRLALRPQGGWINKRKLVLDLIALAFISVMGAVLVKLLESRQAVDGELSEAAQQVAREQAERKQAQADGSELKQKLSALQTGLKEVELRFQHAQSRADQIQAQFEGVVREREGAVQAHQAEQQRLTGELEGAQKTIQQLQSRLDAAIQSEKETAAAGAKQIEQNQAAVLELRKQLESASRSAHKAAETGAARLAELEQSNGELKARVPDSMPTPKPEPPVADAMPATESPVPSPTAKRKERKPKRPDNQMHLFGTEDSKAPPTSKASPKEESTASAPDEKGEESAPARRLPAAPPVDLAVLRTATHQIVPLLADADPGAQDCLRDNRTAFRSAFTPEGYVEFEQLVKSGEFAAALEQLKKAARKHGVGGI